VAAAGRALTSMDFETDDARPAHVKVSVGIEKLIRRTIANHPSGFFAYIEPQAYRRTSTRRAEEEVLDHLYERTLRACSKPARRRHDRLNRDLG